jgi:glucuronate isomerase
VWRREVCGFLAQLAAEHRISKKDAAIVARELSYDNAKKAYKL